MLVLVSFCCHNLELKKAISDSSQHWEYIYIYIYMYIYNYIYIYTVYTYFFPRFPWIQTWLKKKEKDLPPPRSMKPALRKWVIRTLYSPKNSQLENHPGMKRTIFQPPRLKMLVSGGVNWKMSCKVGPKTSYGVMGPL